MHVLRCQARRPKARSDPAVVVDLGCGPGTAARAMQARWPMARVLALEPKVLLLDEPCSGLDPISTAKIEEALQELKPQLSVVLVTNNVKQAARSSDRTAFLLMGELVEHGRTAEMFTSPTDTRTNDYISGKFG